MTTTDYVEGVDFTLYWDNACFGQGGTPYLELHALRAPVGNYKRRYLSGDESAYDRDVMAAIEAFEIEHDVQLFQLGRSGRHICLKDTPANRARYAELQSLAVDAAKALWASMRLVTKHTVYQDVKVPR